MEKRRYIYTEQGSRDSLPNLKGLYTVWRGITDFPCESYSIYDSEHNVAMLGGELFRCEWPRSLEWLDWLNVKTLSGYIKD